MALPYCHPPLNPLHGNTETNRIQLVLFNMHNRTLGSYLDHIPIFPYVGSYSGDAWGLFQRWQNYLDPGTGWSRTDVEFTTNPSAWLCVCLSVGQKSQGQREREVVRSARIYLRLLTFAFAEQVVKGVRMYLVKK
jgi:hypothetical protein